MSSKKSVNIKVVKDNFKKFKKGLLESSKIDLLVGVPQEKVEREGNSEPITNAELMFIHTKGSPLKNIPARPTIEPAIKENKERITSMYSKAILKYLNGQDGRPDLEKIGLWVVNKVKAKFGSDDLVPNSEATIKAKGSDKPLIDTGQLRNSITYVIRKK